MVTLSLRTHPDLSVHHVCSLHKFIKIATCFHFFLVHQKFHVPHRKNQGNGGLTIWIGNAVDHHDQSIDQGSDDQYSFSLHNRNVKWFAAHVWRCICRNTTTSALATHGAPPHFNNAVKTHIKHHFPGSWTCHGGPQNWHPTPINLKLLDSFLWNHVGAGVQANAGNMRCIAPSHFGCCNPCKEGQS